MIGRFGCRAFFLSTLLFSQLARAHLCGIVLWASAQRFEAGAETPADRLLAYVDHLYQIGVLNSDQIREMRDNLLDGRLINPLEADELRASSSAIQIHSDRIDEYLKLNFDYADLGRRFTDMWNQVQSERHVRQKVTEDTRSIFAPVSVSLPADLQPSNLVDWYPAKDGFPMYTTWVRGKTFVGDLQTLFRRKLANQNISWPALFRRQDGTPLIAYYGKANHILIENVHTGEQIDDLDLPKLFQTWEFGEPRKMFMEMDSLGTITLYIQKSFGTSTWMAYNLTERHPYLLEPTPGPYQVFDPASGQNLVRSLKDQQRLKVIRLSEHDPEVVLDEDQSDSLGWHAQVGGQSTWDGKTLFYAFNQEQIKIFDLSNPTPLLLKFQTSLLDSHLFIGFYESKDQGINAILQFKRKEGEDWSVGRLDASSSLSKCELPDSSDLELDHSVSGIRHHYPNFLPLKLSDRRRLLIGLAEETDSDRKEASAKKLYAVDLALMDAQVMDVSAFDVGKLLSVQKLNDGRVIGYFSRDNKLKVLQLLGPHDGKTFKEMTQQL